MPGIRTPARWPREALGALALGLALLLLAAGWSLAVHVQHLVGLAGLAAALPLAWARARLAALAAAGSGLFLLAPFAPQLLPRPTPIAAGCRLSLLSFNAKLTRAPLHAEVAALLARHRADLIVILESEQPEALVAALRAEPTLAAWQAAEPANPHVMLFSRFPIRSLPPQGELALAEVTIAGRPVRLAGGIALKPTIDAAATEGFRQRLIASAAGTRAAGAGGFLAGVDLNAGPEVPGVRRLRATLGDAFASAGHGFGDTFPAPGRRSGLFGPFLRLDVILHDAAFRPLAAAVLPDYADSTHYPVRAEFAFLGHGPDAAPCP